MTKYTGEILDSGIGSKDRRAALVAAFAATLADTHGNSAESRVLLGILADAETRLAARRARKAERAEDGVPVTLADDRPVSETPANDSPIAPKAGKPRKATGKQRAAKPAKANGKAAKVRKDAGTVPCLSCFKQTPLDTATVYPEGHVCPPCEAAANE